MDQTVRIDELPSVCVVARASVEIPYVLDGDFLNFVETVEFFEKRREVGLRWELPENWSGCRECEAQGKLCGLDGGRNRTFCQAPTHHGRLFLFSLICFLLLLD